MLEIKGLLESRIFTNEQTGFGIFRIALLDEDNKSMTIKGPLASLDLDSIYLFEGSYEEHHSYGLQFKVNSFKEVLPSEEEHVIRYLSGPSFPGIGIKSAEAIVEKYGNNVLEEIKDNQEFTMDVKGISAKKLQNILERTKA